MDVRFAEEEAVIKFIHGALEDALGEHNLIPTERIYRNQEAEITDYDQLIIAQKVQGEINDFVENEYGENRNISMREGDVIPQAKVANYTLGAFPRRNSQENPQSFSQGNPQTHSQGNSQTFSQESTPPVFLTPPAERPFFRNYHIFGLLFNTYWLIAQNDSLFLIDQHAAHERILYEEILHTASQTQVHAQPLLTPMPLRLTPREMLTLQDNAEHFTRLGFELNIQEEAELTAVPLLFKGPVSSNFFMELLDKLADSTTENDDDIYANKTELIAMAACKAAVKSGDNLSHAEANEMIRQLLKMENPFTCPHGRPTIIEITQRELTRRFKRG